MQKIFNSSIDKWERPWDRVKFDDLYNRDDRFFALVVKGTLSWLTDHIVMYGKPVRHFILNTGSSYMYVESDGYKFSWTETTGEDMIYMQLPRCIVTVGDLTIPTEELTSPFVRGTYERQNSNNMQGYNAEIRRLPIELELNLDYIMSNFNESIVIMEEVVNKLVFQRYFSIVYLGQVVECSIEVPQNFKVETNRIDLSGTDVVQKTMSLSIKVCTNYPMVNERTEISNDKVIATFNGHAEMFYRSTGVEHTVDKETQIVE